VKLARIWRNYALRITLAGLFLTSLTLQTWMGWTEFVATPHVHREAAEAFGDSGYILSSGPRVAYLHNFAAMRQ
jgi:hypothetical protein